MSRLFKRGETWWIDYTLNGQRKRKSTGLRDKKLAKIALRDLQCKLERGKLDLTVDMKISEWFERWKKTRTDKAANTQRNHSRVISNFIEFAAGKGVTKLSQLSKSLLEEYKFDCVSRLQPVSVATNLQILNKFFNDAKKTGHLEDNPLKYVDKVRVPRKEMDILSQAETAQLLEFIQSRSIGPIISLLTLTGLRASEATFLQWKDIDFSSGNITVRNKPDLGFITKTMQRRNVPLHPVLHDILQKHFESRSPVPSLTDFCFPGRNGGTRSPKCLLKLFKDALRVSGIEFNGRKITLHTLRHSIATNLLLSRAASLTDVQGILGHASVKTTADRYAHVVEEHKRLAMSKWNISLGKSEEMKQIGG